MTDLSEKQVKPTDIVKTWGRMTLVGLDESGNEFYWHTHYRHFFLLKKDPFAHIGGTGTSEYFVQIDPKVYNFDPSIIERAHVS